MNKNCCLRESIKLDSHGVGLVTRHVYYPKHASMIQSRNCKDGNEYYPVLSFAEGISLLWRFDYAVQIVMPRRYVFVDNKFNEFEYVVKEEENYDLYNEADLLAEIIIQIIKSGFLTVEMINQHLSEESKIWFTETDKEINNVVYDKRTEHED